jgi:hypothetical protein
MVIVDELSLAHASYLKGTYDCVDRITINAYFVPGLTPACFRLWWRRWHDGSDDQLDDAHLMRVVGRFTRRLQAYCNAHDIPMVWSASDERKHEKAEQLIPSDPNFQGLFLVQVSKGPAPVWTAKRRYGNWIDLHRKSPWPHVNHYCFHIMDPEWGHITIRVSGHPPFGAMVILNGHEWVERQAARQGLVFAKESNCFTDCSDFAALNQIADTLNSESSIGRLAEVCDRWIYSSCLCFGLTCEEQEQSGFRYSYSAFQIEYSRNLIFKRGADLDEIYQKLVDLTRPSFCVKKVKTIFGQKRDPYRTKGKAKAPTLLSAQLTVEKPRYDLTMFRLQFGKLAVKMYDKGECVLRIEGVAHDTKQLKCGKVLSKLPDIIDKLRSIVIRFLNSLRWAHTAFLGNDTLDSLPLPSQRGNCRIAGIDMNQVRIRRVIEAIIALAPKPRGFSVAELASHVRSQHGLTADQYTDRQAAYDIRKARAKGIVGNVERTRRYAANKEQLQTAAALLIIRDKIIKPIMESVAKPIVETESSRHQLDLHYITIQKEIRATFQTLGIAV